MYVLVLHQLVYLYNMYVDQVPNIFQQFTFTFANFAVLLTSGSSCACANLLVLTVRDELFVNAFNCLLLLSINLSFVPIC